MDAVLAPYRPLSQNLLDIGVMAGVAELIGGGSGGCRFGVRILPTENSFVAGTKVLLADGKTKPIEKVKVGDKIKTIDPKTGKTVVRKVTASFGGKHYDHLVQITIDTDGKHGHHTGTITATEHHKFWNPAKHVWTRADQLTPGTTLSTLGGQTVHVLHAYYAFGHPTVHDLTIADLHTFYVEVDGTFVLVHNAGGAGPCNVGKTGEASSGIVKNTKTIIINGRPRIPDEFDPNAGIIGEVKNVKYQYLSTQLKDDLSYAQANGFQFNLYVRNGTRLSGPVQALVDAGEINLIRNIP